MADQQQRRAIGGLNVQSLPARGWVKMPLVRNLIEEHHIDIFVLGESWLTSEVDAANLVIRETERDNFIYCRQDRLYHRNDTPHGRRGGGLIVYIRGNVTFTVDSYWESPDNNVQFVEISITEPIRFDLVAIYSPNRKHRQYVINLMRFFLERNEELHIPVMFVGDLNIDPGRGDDNEQFEAFRTRFTANCLIRERTHFPESGRPSCIDHIITNLRPIGQPQVIDPQGDISKHRLVYCVVGNNAEVCADDENATSVCQLKNCTDAISLLESLPVLAEAGNRCVLTLLSEGDNLNTVKGFVQRFHLAATVQQLFNRVSILVQIDNQNIIANLRNFMQRLQRPVRCTLAIILPHHQPVNPTQETLSYPVCGFDCFLLKCLRADLAGVENKFLREYFVCSETNNGDCYKLFNTKEKLTKHWTQNHNICPDPLHQNHGPYKNLRKHIEAKHQHLNHNCRAPNCDKIRFHTMLERDKHERTEHHVCFWCDLVFANVEALDEHHDGTHMKCTYCDKLYKNQKGVNIHISKTPRCKAEQSTV